MHFPLNVDMFNRSLKADQPRLITWFQFVGHAIDPWGRATSTFLTHNIYKHPTMAVILKSTHPNPLKRPENAIIMVAADLAPKRYEDKA
jgi:hypothetical protein